jgi:hypothetical protein
MINIWLFTDGSTNVPSYLQDSEFNIIIQRPITAPQSMYDKLTSTMGVNRITELYTHMQVWKTSLTTNSNQFIIYQNCQTNYSEDDIIQTIKFVNTLNNQHLFMLGSCNVSCQNFISTGKYLDFNIINPKYLSGYYSYMITPIGAQCLLNQIVSNPLPVSELITYVSSMKRCIVGTLTPSMLKPSGIRSLTCPPCASQSNLTVYALMWVLLIIIVIAVIVWLSLNIQLQNSNYEVKDVVVYEKPALISDIKPNDSKMSSKHVDLEVLPVPSLDQGSNNIHHDDGSRIIAPVEEIDDIFFKLSRL